MHESHCLGSGFRASGCFRTCRPANPRWRWEHPTLVRSTTRPYASQERRALSSAVAHLQERQETMKNERNPIPIDSKRHKKTATKAVAKHTATRRDKTPAKTKKAGPSKTSTKNKVTDRARRAVKSRKPEPEAHSDSVPARLPENKHPDLHQRSYAAHLDAGSREPQTKPVGILRYGSFAMARKQP